VYRVSWVSGTGGRRAVAGAIAGAIGVVIGVLFVCTDMVVSGYDAGTVLSTEYLPVITGDLIATIILVPILVYAWEPVKAQLGR
jgi:hypothetical protein